MPVSVTFTVHTVTPPGPGRHEPSIVTPPVSVNLIALLTRLVTIWRMRPASPTTAPGAPCDRRQAMRRPLASAVPRISSVTSASRRCMWKGAGSISRRPASTLLKSRMSLMIASSDWPESNTMRA